MRVGKNRKLLFLYILGLLYISPLFLRYFIPVNFLWGIYGFYYYVLLMVIFLLISIIAVYLFAVFFIKRIFTKHPPRMEKYLSPLFFLSYFILLLIINVLLKKIVLGNFPIGSNFLKFDSYQWQNNITNSNASAIGLTPRQMMLKHLLTEVLIGKRKNEIESLLGKSLDSNYFSNIDRDMLYFLGPERSTLFGIDSEWLIIWLDEEGKFYKYKIISD